MNNNNHFNTNNWIGTTHLDFFKNSSNALSNYTYNTSNILENDILINSNINYLYTSNSSNSNIIYTSNVSNIILDRYDKLIKEEEEEILLPLPTTLKHTYIYNKNEGGEIRFQNQAYITDILGFPAGTPNYKVKIDIDGKLKLYWVYNPLVSLIYLGGWHEPISEIAGLTADSINQGGLITALQGEVVIIKKYTDSELSLIWAYIEGIQQGIITPGQTTITPAENARDMLNWGSPEIPATPSTPLIPASPIQNANAISTFQERVQALANIREVIRNSTIIRITDQVTSYITQNPITSFFLGTGFTSLGIAYGILQGIEYNRYYNGVIENVIQNNSNLSAGVRLSLHNLNQSNIIASNLIDYCSNTYYLGISQGFLNSNTITQQYLNSINTNQLTLSQTNISNIFVNSNLFNDIFYTENRKYPPKLFTSSSTQSSMTYLNQNPIYYETINLNSIDINYGSGTYEIYSSENNSTTISLSGTDNNVFDVLNDNKFSYAFFASNGTFTINSNLICDILVVGGGGSGGRTIGGGGGGGAVVYITNAIINAGTYNVVVGQGGALNNNAVLGNKGGNSSFAGIIAEGGGASASYNNPPSANGGSGGSGGGAGADDNVGGGDTAYPTGAEVGTESSLGGFTGTIYGNKGGDGLLRALGSVYLGGGGGGGAGEVGLNGNVSGNGAGGRGGNGVEINITGTNLYWGGGGGGSQYNSTDGGVNSRAGNGGLGGGGGGASAQNHNGTGGTGGLNNGSSGSSQIGGNGGANTGGGGGAGSWTGSRGGAGGSGVVIIRYLKPSNQTKKELFNLITNDVGSEFGSFNYNSSTGYYLSTDRYIKNDYYGDFLIIKLASKIILNRIRIYSRPSFVERAPSLFKLYGSLDNFIWEEITDFSINTPLTTDNYSLGYFEKVFNNQKKDYIYFGFVVNKIIGGNIYANTLNITEIELYGKEFIVSSTSNNLANYTLNNVDRYNITLPQENFWYDNTNNLFGYDLNIENYIPSSNLGGGFKCRSFRIQTIVPKADWRTGNNLYFNNQYINNPETLTIHMNNSSNYFGGSITPNDNYANGIILGKSRDTNEGYWNLIPDNYNYIRYLTRIGWSVDVILEKLL